MLRHTTTILIFLIGTSAACNKPMFTYHPTAKRTRNGYVPMVIVRNPKGQCVGSKAGKRTFPYADTAKMFARMAAETVTLESVRVAS